jgi:serine/threonine protein phosphatase PrpC
MCVLILFSKGNPENEDNYKVAMAGSEGIFGVFDGHGGKVKSPGLPRQLSEP